MRISPLLLATTVAACLWMSPATAQEGAAAQADAAPAADKATASEAPTPTWDFSGNISAMSDYVWRGVSQTQGRPALQGEFSVTHASGVYAGVFVSNVDFTAAGDPADGVNTELDGFVGWTGDLTDRVNLDVFVSRVTFPGYKPGFDYNYTEVEAKLTLDDTWYGGIAYSPDIFNLGGKGIYTYVGIDKAIGESGWNVQAQLGHYNLNDAAGDSYNDVLLGVGRSFGPVKAALQFTTTGSYGPALSENLDDRKQADSRVNLVVAWEF